MEETANTRRKTVHEERDPHVQTPETTPAAEKVREDVADEELRLRRAVDPDWEHGDPTWHMVAQTSGGATHAFLLVGNLHEVRLQREARKRGQR